KCIDFSVIVFLVVHAQCMDRDPLTEKQLLLPFIQRCTRCWLTVDFGISHATRGSTKQLIQQAFICGCRDLLEVCPALPRKIFRLTRRANQRYDSARLTRQEGRAHVTNARGDAVDVKATTDERS